MSGKGKGKGKKKDTSTVGGSPKQLEETNPSPNSRSARLDRKRGGGAHGHLSSLNMGPHFIRPHPFLPGSMPLICM